MPIVFHLSEKFLYSANKTSLKIPFHKEPNVWSFMYIFFWNAVYAYLFSFILAVILRTIIWDRDEFFRLFGLLSMLVFVYFEEFYLWSLLIKSENFLRDAFKWSAIVTIFEFAIVLIGNSFFLRSFDMFFMYLILRGPSFIVHFGRVASTYFGLKRFPKFAIVFFVIQILGHYAINIGNTGWPIPPKKLAEIGKLMKREKEIQDLKFKEAIENYKKSRGIH
jgi:hypothetical protein